MAGRGQHVPAGGAVPVAAARRHGQRGVALAVPLRQDLGPGARGRRVRQQRERAAVVCCYRVISCFSFGYFFGKMQAVNCK